MWGTTNNWGWLKESKVDEDRRTGREQMVTWSSNLNLKAQWNNGKILSERHEPFNHFN